MALDFIVYAKAIAKLVSMGLAVYRGAHTDGVQREMEESLKAIQDLLDAGGHLAVAGNGKLAPRLQAVHIGLVASAFGEAWNEQYKPRFLKKEVALERQRDAAVAWALQDLPRLGSADLLSDLALINHLLAGVLNTPYYRALWKAFTDNALPDLESRWTEPLIHVAGADDLHAFESRVRRAYAEAIASPAGTELRSYFLELPSERGRIIHELHVRDLAIWHRRHVFGNVVGHARLPDMPLSEMYVEPLSSMRTPSEQDGATMPVLRHIAEVLHTTDIAVVTAHFGHGKSLTARSLAGRLAAEYVSATEGGHRLPFFIKCLEDLASSEPTLPRMVKRALWRQVGLVFKLGLKDTDEAFGPPADTQGSVFIVDGLDEVTLTQTAISQLFEHLKGQATAHHKIVVFSRPEVLPVSRLRELGIPILDLKPFSSTGDSGGQIGEWLAKWNAHSGNRPKIPFEDLVARDLLELAQTPILLFMIAETWDSITSTDGIVRKFTLYEAFLTRIARGKHESDSDQHKPIALAAEQLHDRLVELARIPSEATVEQAMLWALSRVAWESHCLEQHEKFLRQRQVVELFARELNIDEETGLYALCDGVLLALQADFAPGGSRILFGHRSFREFLVARYWDRILRIMVDSSPAEWQRREDPLFGGRLLGREDQSFTFLVEMLEYWEPTKQGTLRQWAEQTFNDERISRSGTSDDALLYHDRRAHLREAALAIGSSVPGGTGIQAKRSTVLRSLLASFWARREDPIIIARKLRHPDAVLDNIVLREADFTEADLSGCILSAARFSRCEFVGARLDRSFLAAVRMFEVDLTNASLSRVLIERSDFHHCTLDDVDFSHAKLGWSVFSHCTFARAKFLGVQLSDCTLPLDMRTDSAMFVESHVVRSRYIIQGYLKRQSGCIAQIVRAVESLCPPSAVSYDFSPMMLASDSGTTIGTSIDVIHFSVTIPHENADQVIAAIRELPLPFALPDAVESE